MSGSTVTIPGSEVSYTVVPSIETQSTPTGCIPILRDVVWPVVPSLCSFGTGVGALLYGINYLTSCSDSAKFSAEVLCATTTSLLIISMIRLLHCQKDRDNLYATQIKSDIPIVLGYGFTALAITVLAVAGIFSFLPKNIPIA